jgi:hypothetical protein
MTATDESYLLSISLEARVEQQNYHHRRINREEYFKRLRTIWERLLPYPDDWMETAGGFAVN